MSSATSGAAVSTDALRERVSGLMPQAWDDLSRAVSFKSVADGLAGGLRADGRVDSRGVHERRRRGRPRPRDVRRRKTVTGHAPGPPGAPTVLLYFHHDVQPASDEGWESPPWQLTERNGRWYGRGAADCGEPGGAPAALRAMRGVAGEREDRGRGSEEQGTGGLEDFTRENPELLRADAILVCDTGNVMVGMPTLTTSLRGWPGVGDRADARQSRALGHVRRRGAGRARGADPHAGDLARRPGLDDGPRTRWDADVAGSVPGGAVPQGRGRARRRRPHRRRRGRGHPLGATDCDSAWHRLPSVVARPPPCRMRRAHRPPDPARGGCEGRAVELIEHLEAVAPWHVQLEFERKPTAIRSRGRPKVRVRRDVGSDARVLRTRRDAVQGKAARSRSAPSSRRRFLGPRSCCSASRSRSV